MNQQFQTQFLLEDYDELESLRDMLYELGANEDAVAMLISAVRDGILEPSKAVEIVKATAGISEDGGSMSAGVAPTLEPVRVKKMEEDAPMLAAGKADISTSIKDKFTKVEDHPKLKSIELKNMWGTNPTAMSEDVDEVWTREDFPKITQLLDKIKQQNADLYDKIKWALEMDLAPHTYDDVAAVAAKAGIQENYNRFKKETKMRPKQDQYHEAIKVVNKKLDEVNRILEFTSRMREELSEGDEMLEVKTRTAKTMDKAKTKIAEAYKKLKQLN